MQKTILSFFLVLFFFPFFSHAEEVNVGFIQGLWYSEEPVFVGVPTRVYVAFRNNTPHDLTGTIRFTDNGKRIGSSNVNVLSGRIAEAWIDWVPTEGDHALGATLSDATLHAIGKSPEPIDVAGMVAEDTVSVDLDTDGDKIGNKEDTDDDGDGVSDADESARGTDPLRKNPKPEETPKVIEEKEVDEEPAPVTVQNTPGLEQYLPDGTLNDVVGGLTETIRDTKVSLDTYRNERKESASENVDVVETGTTTDSDTATITRTTIPKDTNILDALVGGVIALGGEVYTFVLFILSQVLGRPAFVQLVLLLLLLYGFYRMARYFGRRPGF